MRDVPDEPFAISAHFARYKQRMQIGYSAREQTRSIYVIYFGLGAHVRCIRSFFTPGMVMQVFITQIVMRDPHVSSDDFILED